MRKPLTALLVCSIASVATAADPVFIDTFDDNNIGPWWTVHTVGQPTVSEVNARLEAAFPANSTGSLFSADVTTVKWLVGDFDTQVDFALLNWPAHNGVRVGLIASPLTTGPGAGIERVSRIPGECGGAEDYCTDIAGQVAWVATDDLAGTLRLVRTGSTVSGYYLDSENWVLVGSEPWTDGDTHLALAGWSHDSVFRNQDVLFAFDDFQINSGNLVPEPASAVILLAGLGAVLRRRKRLNQ